MSELKRITIFVLHHDDSADFDWVHAWLEKWEGQVIITDYSCGGWEHLWNLEASQEALNEVPSGFLCSSAWSAPEIFEKSSFWQKLKRLFTK